MQHKISHTKRNRIKNKQDFASQPKHNECLEAHQAEQGEAEAKPRKPCCSQAEQTSAAKPCWQSSFATAAYPRRTAKEMPATGHTNSHTGPANRHETTVKNRLQKAAARCCTLHCVADTTL